MKNYHSPFFISKLLYSIQFNTHNLFEANKNLNKKLERVTPFVRDPTHTNYTTRQNPAICGHPLYIVITSETII